MTQTNLLNDETSIRQDLSNKHIKEDQYTRINDNSNKSNQNYEQARLVKQAKLEEQAELEKLVKSTQCPTVAPRVRAPELAKKEQAFLFKISSSPLNFKNLTEKLISMAGISFENGECVSNGPFSKFPDKFSDELGPHYNLYCFHQRSENLIISQAYNLALASGNAQEDFTESENWIKNGVLDSETDLQSNFFALFLSFSLDILPNVSERVKYLLESYLRPLVPNITVEDCKRRKPTLDEGHIKARSLRSFRGALIRLFFKNPLLNFGKTKIIEVRGTKAQFFKVYRAAARNMKLELSYEPNLEINTLNQFAN